MEANVFQQLKSEKYNVFYYIVSSEYINLYGTSKTLNLSELYLAVNLTKANNVDIKESR